MAAVMRECFFMKMLKFIDFPVRRFILRGLDRMLAGRDANGTRHGIFNSCLNVLVTLTILDQTKHVFSKCEKT